MPKQPKRVRFENRANGEDNIVKSAMEKERKRSVRNCPSPVFAERFKFLSLMIRFVYFSVNWLNLTKSYPGQICAKDKAKLN